MFAIVNIVQDVTRPCEVVISIVRPLPLCY